MLSLYGLPPLTGKLNVTAPKIGHKILARAVSHLWSVVRIAVIPRVIRGVLESSSRRRRYVRYQ